MIETVNLTKKYGDFIALDNLNLSIEEGTCFGFIGPNGAGKTTTIKILATLLKPTWGEARIDGKVVGYQNHLIRPLIGYVPDFMGAYQDMTVSEYLEFFAACYGVPSAKRDRTISEVLALTDLTHKTESEVNGLSRGMQQRLAVARVLIHDPKVLLMDEPSSGLDPRARIEMRELLKELRRIGKTILISSHILSELADLCNAVGVIEQGKLAFAGALSDLMARAKVGKIVQIGVEARAEDAATLLRGVRGVSKVELVADDGSKRLDVELVPNAEVAASELAARLLAQGFRLTRLAPEEISLETAFMRLTKGLVS
ncbi:MAG: ABC transporter ATP-binding protein [Planctomycetota bacterium]|nr:MAG: ABC transporter ATP-binding protein [Planctomycetota bacterium]